MQPLGLQDNLQHPELAVRLLYIDIDTLRPDHLGCYGYHRNTSPNIDAIAQDALRFDNCYVSDAPCLPSRSSTWSGRFGFHTGVVNHGGTAADPFSEGHGRGFTSEYARTSWISLLRNAGLWTATVSPFAERHSAWWWYAGYREMYDTGKRGSESAHEVAPLALDWLKRNARRINGSCTSTCGTHTRPTARRLSSAIPSPTIPCRPG
jgi:choline-sulfatase